MFACWVSLPSFRFGYIVRFPTTAVHIVFKRTVTCENRSFDMLRKSYIIHELIQYFEEINFIFVLSVYKSGFMEKTLHEDTYYWWKWKRENIPCK